MKELEYPFDADLLLKRKIKFKKELLLNTEGFIKKKIAILGGSTTHEIKNMLELFLLNYKILPTFWESEYNRFFEDGMFDNPELVEFAPEIIYIHTSSKNIINLPNIKDSVEEIELKKQAEISRYFGLWDHLADVYKCTIIQNNFELPSYRLLGNQDCVLKQGKVSFINELNLEFSNYARTHENFYIHDICYESACYGLDRWSDPLYWNMYKYAMALPAIPYTAYGVALIIKAQLGKNKKLLALDLDNTLWGGVIGDDGVENIEVGQETPVGQAYSSFQKYIREHKDLGVLLAVVSKNNDDIARTGFSRKDSVLKEDDFVAFKANWDPKNLNIMQIANEINLLPESFVFVDDNPAEREIVKQTLAGVAVPDMLKVEDYIKTIDRAGYFEVLKLSKDDLNRSDMYVANLKRNQLQLQFTDYVEYLKSLNMKAEIKSFEKEYFSRITQLTNKSNQFNLTTKRYTQAEIENVAASKQHITLYGKLDDKFGENGVVSVVIGKIEDKNLHIELWLMSCRVLKRDMEFAMMDELVKHAKEKNINTIYGYYYPTEKNAMVKDFYQLQGFDKIEEDDKGNIKWEYKIPTNRENKNKVIEIL